MIRVLVSQAPIDAGVEQARLEQQGVGAVATFSGIVRADDGVTMLELEHFPGVTEAMLERLCSSAVERWRLSGATVIHRVGPMQPGERIVFVGAAAPHRAAALDAVAYLIDRLKTDAPFWKKETRAAGPEWVEQRGSDISAANRWSEISRVSGSAPR